MTMMIDFLVVKCPSAFNGVLGRPLLKSLKAMTSIHCLTMKFPTAAGIGQEDNNATPGSAIADH